MAPVPRVKGSAAAVLAADGPVSPGPSLCIKFSATPDCKAEPAPQCGTRLLAPPLLALAQVQVQVQADTVLGLPLQ